MLTHEISTFRERFIIKMLAAFLLSRAKQHYNIAQPTKDRALIRLHTKQFEQADLISQM